MKIFKPIKINLLVCDGFNKNCDEYSVQEFYSIFLYLITWFYDINTIESFPRTVDYPISSLASYHFIFIYIPVYRIYLFTSHASQVWNYESTIKLDSWTTINFRLCFSLTLLCWLSFTSSSFYFPSLSS